MNWRMKNHILRLNEYLSTTSPHTLLKKPAYEISPVVNHGGNEDG